MDSSIPAPLQKHFLPDPSPLKRFSTSAFWPGEPPKELATYKPVRTQDRTPYGKTKLAVDQSGKFLSVRLHQKDVDEKHALSTDAEAVSKAILQQIKAENSVLMRLQKAGGHEGLIRCLHDVECESYHWSVREFSGTTLLDVIANHGAIPNDVAKGLFLQLANAVTYLHSNGYSHLNLNLENVYVFNDETNEGKEKKDGKHRLKLGGFSCVAELPKKGAAFEAIIDRKPGKLQYMAPEIFDGQSFFGKQADAYSLGVILFEMLTGHPAYEQPSMGDTRFHLLYGGKLSTLVEAWGHKGRLKQDAIDLLGALVCKPGDRLTVEQIAAHRWLAGE